MKDKLYGLLKAKLFNHIFSVIFALAAPIVLYFLLFNKGSAYPPLVYMTAALCLFAICTTVKDLSRSLMDYSVYMRNGSCEEIIGKVVSFHTERSGKSSRRYPVVQDEATGMELILKIPDVKDIIQGRKYKFLYLDRTKLAVIAETVWEALGKDMDPEIPDPGDRCDALGDDDVYWTPPDNDSDWIERN